MGVMESVALFFKEGSSDKVYQACIESHNDGYVVNFEYGRRGSTLTSGTKTPDPVPFIKAKAIYDKLVKEKTSKGYTVDGSGTPYSSTDKEARDTGFRCQLLNPIDEEEALDLVADPDWWMQEKYDGKRVPIKKERQEITGLNRKGLTIGLPEPIVACMKRIGCNCMLDGECISDRYYAFDCMSYHDKDTTAEPYSQRFHRLADLLTPEAMYLSHGIRDMPTLVLANTARTPSEKKKMLAEMRKRNAEGVVFKRITAPYTAGRPNSGGAQRKFKFYATASAVVLKRTSGKRSVEMGVYDQNVMVGVGAVTVLPNFDVPEVGKIIEVRYLYAHKGGKLYQPIYLGERDDIRHVDCVLSQLKYKKEEEE
jgi:bifunctional non-homologous end joining protein LigD